MYSKFLVLFFVFCKNLTFLYLKLEKCVFTLKQEKKFIQFLIRHFDNNEVASMFPKLKKYVSFYARAKTNTVL